ncbi:Putative acetyltransferase EpsM [Planktothrix tepida]|uniref:Sugar O-acyltransferase, sialic acid O-acetyltransferase NeuD family n=1 Tax=Planktothrix tepida PCC 9214 TaxID=671072 RepID=A0A1J1LQT5_9CYAN|nr:acetyltransferase [Planktothrix tepida]CAD5962039.1 Putative acetyltransferase EpsM [Planktothrix tepida]CUR34799.1 Sugar O-acyltransferase, sialic acid O-acetyltransferase NeuD family [Planktothrix tepida PCC 9214]
MHTLSHMNINETIKNVVFWGAAGHAKVLRACLQRYNINLIALFDNNNELSSPFDDVSLYYGKEGFRRWLHSTDLQRDKIGFLVAIGGEKSKGKDRVEIQEYLESFGLIPIIAKHPTAFIDAHVDIGAGSQIMAHATICVETRIGRACLINTGAIVDHECVLSDGVCISPGARLAGCVTVGRYSMIGVGAVILPRINIGEGATVGGGAVVTRDVLPHTVVIGNPARVLE